MKKIKQPLALSLFFILIFSCSFSFGAPVSVPADNPQGWNTVRLSEIVKLSVKDLQKLTGKKMKLKEKIGFSIAKAKMKRWLKKNRDVNLTTYIKTAGEEKKKFDGSWFTIGLFTMFLAVLAGAFLGLIAGIFLFILPIALLYGTKQGKPQRDSYLLGFIAGILLVLVLGAIFASSFSFGGFGWE